ncbi:MAG: ATP-binding protein [Snowella sp.]|nr:ATP-binding protein [Snowella sp.]
MTKQEFDKHFLAITPKPRQVILQVLQGKKDDEIAGEMQAAVTTIRKHIENLCDLFDIPSEIDGIKRRRRDVLIALFLEYRPDLVNTEVSIAFPAIAEVSKPEERAFWQERIDVSGFIGRAEDLEALRASVFTDKCRLVGIQGLPGIGKTFLAAKFAVENRTKFDYFIWRSLNESTNFADLVKYWLEKLAPEVLEANSELSKLIEQVKEQYEEIKKLSPKEVTDEQKTAYRNCANQLLDHLLDVLRNHRCLLILDNFDRILLRGDFAGDYQSHNKPYGLLLERLAKEVHESCLLILSREKPREIHAIANSAIKDLSLEGLDEDSALELLGVAPKKQNGVASEEQNSVAPKDQTENWKKLINNYNRNPLALKLLKPVISELWGNNIEEFLNQDSLTKIIMTFGTLIERQIARLNLVERYLLYYIACSKESLTIANLNKILEILNKNNMLESDNIIATIVSLRNRFLLERTKESFFTLQPVVRECTLKSLGQDFIKEMQEGSDYLLLIYLDISELEPKQIHLILREFLKENSHTYWLDLFKKLEQSHVEDSLLKGNLKAIQASIQAILEKVPSAHT